MPALAAMTRQRLEKLEQESLRRNFVISEPEKGIDVRRNGRTLVSFGTNDYLGLSRHPNVKKAAAKALERYGAGAGASRLIAGNHPYYAELEALLCRAKNTQAALVFGSGYLASLGVIPALVKKGDVVIADRLIHSSLIDGIRLSGATLCRYSHNDLNSLNNILNNNINNKTIIITETVFSMDGDLAPLQDMRALADRYGAWLMTDDAHGFGVVETPRVADIQMGTLSKGVGCYGGYVCADKETIEYLKNAARTLIYSTALPPAMVAGSCEAVRMILDGDGEVLSALKKALLFTSLLNLPQAQSAIVPVVFGETEKVLRASALLEEAGFYVPAIRPPTVPKNTARLRFSFSALHRDKDIEKLAQIVKDVRCAC